MREEPGPVTCAQMKEIEVKAAERGLSYYQMMENAGTGAAEFIMEKEDVKEKRVLVFCGKGNNGGDGFVVARKLFQAGARVWLILADGPSTTEDAIRNRDLCESLHIAEIAVSEVLSGLSSAAICGAFPADIIVDAVYGTGFHGKLNEHVRDLLHAVNLSTGTKYALDIPSGLSGDSGEADEDTFRADYTLAFHRLKPAHLMKNAQQYCGQVARINIGIGSRLILASKSPRRQELLQLCEIPFSVITADVDEGRILEAVLAEIPEIPLEKSAGEIVKALAHEKAKTILKSIPKIQSDDPVIIGSDTIVVIGEQILGKPESEEEALSMLKLLAGHTHRVYTGVSILSRDAEDTFFTCTKVRFYPWDEEMETLVKSYIEEGTPMDKAGAYGIQDKGALLVESIDGDFYTVMGLPVAELHRRLKRFKL